MVRSPILARLAVGGALAIAVALAAGASGAGASSPSSADQLTLAQRAIRLAITSGTDRYPTGLKTTCVADSRIVQRCRGSWRDSRYGYAGRFFVINDTETISAVFAGIRTDRKCAAREQPGRQRMCRDAVAF